MLFLFQITIGIAQSNKDMIIAGWKCVAVEKASTTNTGKKQNKATDTPKQDTVNIDSLRNEFVGVMYGFRNNGTLIINTNGRCDARKYKVEGNTLTITEKDTIHTTFTILKLNYAEMVLQDALLLIYIYKKQ
jgi:hypothetical protein